MKFKPPASICSLVYHTSQFKRRVIISLHVILWRVLDAIDQFVIGGCDVQMIGCAASWGVVGEK